LAPVSAGESVSANGREQCSDESTPLLGFRQCRPGCLDLGKTLDDEIRILWEAADGITGPPTFFRIVSAV
jgi:hypothetical protein